MIKSTNLKNQWLKFVPTLCKLIWGKEIKKSPIPIIRSE